MIEPTKRIWHNGRLIPWDEAQVHVLAHGLHYGTSIFEGIRCYQTDDGPAIFRAREHIRRFFDSAKIYRMDEFEFSEAEMLDALCELVRVNRVNECYLRPIAFRGYGDLHVLSLRNPLETYIACWPWGRYLGQDAIEKGVDVCVSSWRRFAPGTMPMMAKAGANYMNSQLVLMEATSNGYSEGIALDVRGYVSEGSGENVFVVRDGVIHTPPLGGAVLPGVTRDAVMRIAGDLGHEVREHDIPREALYLADEAFFTGTAAEVTPIRSVDAMPVGSGARGPVTLSLQEVFSAAVRGRNQYSESWLTYVDRGARTSDEKGRQGVA